MIFSSLSWPSQPPARATPISPSSLSTWKPGPDDILLKFTPHNCLNCLNTIISDSQQSPGQGLFVTFPQFCTLDLVLLPLQMTRSPPRSTQATPHQNYIFSPHLKTFPAMLLNADEGTQYHWKLKKSDATSDHRGKVERQSLVSWAWQMGPLLPPVGNNFQVR